MRAIESQRAAILSEAETSSPENLFIFYVFVYN